MAKLKKYSLGLIIVCTLAAIGVGIHKHQFLSSSIEVPAKIVSFQKSPDADDDYATPVLEFEYQNQSKTLVNPYMVNDALFHINQQVSVIFNPQNINEAQMKTAAFQYFPSMFLTLMAILLAVLHLVVFKTE